MLDSLCQSPIMPESLVFMRPSFRLFAAAVFAILPLVITGCASSTPIQRASESKSHFSTPPKLNAHSYSPQDIYRIYERAASGFEGIDSLRRNLERRAGEFSQRQGKSFVVLGEQISHPPYILGNFPRIEIVFALIDKPTVPVEPTPLADKYSNLERLKKLLDEGAITKEEFEKEKAKLLK